MWDRIRRWTGRETPPAPARPAKPQPFRRLADAARADGTHAHVARELLGRIDAIASAEPAALPELFAFLVGAVSETEFDRAAHAAAAAGAPFDAVVEQLRRYRGEAASQALADALGCPLAAAPQPAIDRLEAALRNGAGTAEIAAALAGAAAELPPAALLDRLRVLSPALQAHRLVPPQPAGATPEEAANLAGILGHGAAVEQALAGSTDPEARAFARAAAGDSSDLTALCQARWNAAGIARLPLVATSLPKLFDGVLATGPTLPAVPGFHVTAVVTARDPDPTLLARALASILAQGHAPAEVILVDDGSGPAGAAVLAGEAARDPRIRLIRQDSSTGPYLARNRALEVATGNVLAIQDADDVSHPDRLALQLAALVQNSAVEAVAGAALRFGDDARVQLEHDARLFGDGTMSTVYRQSLFAKLGAFAAVRSRGDVEYRERIRRTLGAEALVHLPAPLMLCRGGADSLSQATGRALTWHLRALRRNFMAQRWDPVDGGFAPPGPLVVPWPLQP